MSALLDEVNALQTGLLEGGGPRYVQRHHDRGKLMVRDRIALLVDPGSPFLELSPLAGALTPDPLGGGIVTGLGTVAGVECVVLANDSTVRGGSLNPTGVTKALRAYEIALTSRSRSSTWSSRAERTCRIRPISSTAAARSSVTWPNCPRLAFRRLPW